MLTLIIRLAMLGGVIVLTANVLGYWLRALLPPAKPAAALPGDRAEARARTMAEQAARRVTAMEVAVAELKDDELWRAIAAVSEAVRRLISALIADPERHRRARRHLGQLLYAAEQTVIRFARHYRGSRDDAARARFLGIAGDLAAEFDRAARDYAKSGAADLELDAEVLSDLIERARRPESDAVSDREEK